MPEHGGHRHRLALRLGRPAGEILDLSTGISPWSYPVPAIPGEIWQCLPEPDDALEASAARYYGSDALLPVPGSQAAIQHLPALRPPGRVVVSAGSYAEHAHAWSEAGHELRTVADDQLDAACNEADVMIVINPDNPTGRLLDPALLLAWNARLARRGGWLIVDEAFADLHPERSLTSLASQRGLIVLRSLGKFFGLAGLRLGFVFAEAELRARIEARLGPWAVSHPARWIGSAALADRHWQQRQGRRLRAASRRLAALLEEHRLAGTGTALYRYVPHPRAAALAEQAAEDAILLRLFRNPPALRLGLPVGGEAWHRLETWLLRTRLN